MRAMSNNEKSVFENDKVMIAFYLVMTTFAVINTFIYMREESMAAAIISAVTGPVWGFALGSRIKGMRYQALGKDKG